MEINEKYIMKALNNIMSCMHKITVTYRTVMSQTLPTVTSAAIDLLSVTVSSAENTYCSPSVSGGTRWRSWLRHCATSPKVAGSISDGVTRHNPSGRTTALGSIQPLTEMSTRNISWG